MAILPLWRHYNTKWRLCIKNSNACKQNNCKQNLWLWRLWRYSDVTVMSVWCHFDVRMMVCHRFIIKTFEKVNIANTFSSKGTWSLIQSNQQFCEIEMSNWITDTILKKNWTAWPIAQKFCQNMLHLFKLKVTKKSVP